MTLQASFPGPQGTEHSYAVRSRLDDQILPCLKLRQRGGFKRIERARKQAEYVEDFGDAVVAFLNFAARVGSC